MVLLAARGHFLANREVSKFNFAGWILELWEVCIFLFYWFVVIITQKAHF